jgi:hypothetical protein
MSESLENVSLKFNKKSYRHEVMRVSRDKYKKNNEIKKLRQ